TGSHAAAPAPARVYPRGGGGPIVAGRHPTEPLAGADVHDVDTTADGRHSGRRDVFGVRVVAATHDQHRIGATLDARHARHRPGLADRAVAAEPVIDEPHQAWLVGIGDVERVVGPAAAAHASEEHHFVGIGVLVGADRAV